MNSSVIGRPDEIIAPESLGHPQFRHDHAVKYAYVAGAMVKGIASTALVARMANAGLLSFYGSGGQSLETIEHSILRIKADISASAPFGVNLIHNLVVPELEQQTAELLLRHNVRRTEAAAYIHLTPALVLFRLKGIHRNGSGQPVVRNRVLAKVSRPEVAQRFFVPPPAEIVHALRDKGQISVAEADLARYVPMADDVCAEADSAGHTDRRVALTLVPAMISLRERIAAHHAMARRVRVGMAGGLGTPEAVAATFILGADFVLTGSINQCTVEAGTSDLVKDLLAAADIQDMEMAPASDLFEIGAKVQVLKKGSLFAARANRLYDLYRTHDSIEQIAPDILRNVEQKYFQCSIQEVWEQTLSYYNKVAPAEAKKAEESPKCKMAMIFRWYLMNTNRLALMGDPARKIDFQIHCGPAMGAFNQFVKGTPLENWRKRHVDDIAELLMRGAADVLNQRYSGMLHACAAEPVGVDTI